MRRYIDADKLVAWCNETYNAQSTVGGKAYVNAFLTKVLSCPTADVVEVVRCKDCKYAEHCYGDVFDCRCPHTPFATDEYSISCNGNDYCSYGERSEGNDLA